MSFEVFEGAPGLKLGVRGTLFVARFRGWPTPASLKRLADAQQLAAQKSAAPIKVLIIIPPVDAEPRDPVMQQLQPTVSTQHSELLVQGAEASESLKGTVGAAAMVILPRGVLAVTIRSFVGALRLMAPAAVPLKTFSALGPAVDFLSPHSPGLLEELEAWVRQP